MAKAAESVPAHKLELYEKLVATNPRVERKGATMPYTSLNGHMFSFLTRTGTLALRLPAGEREAFLKKYKARLFEQQGAVMAEYVQVPDALLAKTRELKKFFDRSYEYVGSLKPKPTTRKKKVLTVPRSRTPSRRRSTGGAR
jgi:TfoX/Sxy family transcriptional regulator of competence genes